VSDRVRSRQPGGSTIRRPAGDPAAQGKSSTKDQPSTRDSVKGSGSSGGRPPGGRPRVGKPPRTKAEKRAAAKAAREAAAAAAARRRYRRQWGIAIGTAVIVIVLVVGGFVLFGGKHKGTTTANPSASAGAAATGAPFPSLPPSADPALGTKPTVKAGTGTPSKLNVTTLVQGTGPALKSGQNVTVNYVGVSYQTGAEFDSSWSRKQTLDFVVGQGKVIPGWDQGLVGVKVGSRVQLDIPANLAYGDNPTDGSPAGPLRFVVDVLGAQ
jgi:peptidylprolyl isomerase